MRSKTRLASTTLHSYHGGMVVFLFCTVAAPKGALHIYFALRALRTYVGCMLR